MKVYSFVLLICLRTLGFSLTLWWGPACLPARLCCYKSYQLAGSAVIHPPTLHSPERRSPACRCLRAHSCSSSSSPSHRSWGAVASSRWEFWLIKSLLAAAQSSGGNLNCVMMFSGGGRRLRWIIFSAQPGPEKTIWGLYFPPAAQ